MTLVKNCSERGLSSVSLWRTNSVQRGVLRNSVNTFEKTSEGAVIGGGVVASFLARPIGCSSMTMMMISPSFIFVTGQS